MNAKIISDALAKALAGEALPSFRQHEFAVLMQAIRDASAPESGPRVREAVGSAAMLLLLAHMQAAMSAERELALLRDAARPH